MPTQYPKSPSLTSYGVQTHLMKKGGHVHMYFLVLQGAKLISPGYQKTAEYFYTLFSTTRAKYPLTQQHSAIADMQDTRICMRSHACIANDKATPTTTCSLLKKKVLWYGNQTCTADNGDGKECLCLINGCHQLSPHFMWLQKRKTKILKRHSTLTFPILLVSSL